jgi:hypothetical protein
MRVIEYPAFTRPSHYRMYTVRPLPSSRVLPTRPFLHTHHSYTTALIPSWLALYHNVPQAHSNLRLQPYQDRVHDGMPACTRNWTPNLSNRQQQWRFSLQLDRLVYDTNSEARWPGPSATRTDRFCAFTGTAARVSHHISKPASTFNAFPKQRRSRPNVTYITPVELVKLIPEPTHVSHTVCHSLISYSARGRHRHCAELLSLPLPPLHPTVQPPLH